METAANKDVCSSLTVWKTQRFPQLSVVAVVLEWLGGELHNTIMHLCLTERHSIQQLLREAVTCDQKRLLSRSGEAFKIKPDYPHQPTNITNILLCTPVGGKRGKNQCVLCHADQRFTL